MKVPRSSEWRLRRSSRADAARQASFLPIAEQPLARQLVWLVDGLRPVRHLVATVHARVARSPQIAERHTGFHRKVEALFEDQQTIEVSGARRDTEVAVVTFAIEGAVTHDLDEIATEELCRALVQRLERL